MHGTLIEELNFFLVENNLISYGNWLGYLYFSKSHDIADQCRSNVGLCQPMSLPLQTHDSCRYITVFVSYITGDTGDEARSSRGGGEKFEKYVITGVI
jgi:hypothetical protein